MAYNQDLPADTTAPTEIRENFRALKNDKIVAAASAIIADSAAKLANAREISLTGDATGSATFDGSTDMSILVDVISADTAAVCTGNAATATKLETARNINGVSFDGTADITITAKADGGNADTIGGYYPNDIMPIGGVIMWSGSVTTIPSKWHLCDGTNGTPNLTDRFILGAGNAYSVGTIGGESTHMLTSSEMPSHTHALTGSGNAYGVGAITTLINGSIYDLIGPGNQVTDGSEGGGGYNYASGYQKVNLATPLTIGYTGSSLAHNNMPPYYALAYIMRIS